MVRKIACLLTFGWISCMNYAHSCSLSEDVIKEETGSYPPGYIPCGDGIDSGSNDNINPANQAEQLINIINILNTVNSSNEEARIREQEEAQMELNRQQEINDRNEARKKILDEQNAKKSEALATKINAEKESVNNDDWRARAGQQAATGPKGKTYIKNVNEYIKMVPDGPADSVGNQHYIIMNTSNKEVLVRWCEQKSCISPNEAATISPGGRAKAVSFTHRDGTEIKYWACLTKYNDHMVLGDKNGACWYIKK